LGSPFGSKTKRLPEAAGAKRDKAGHQGPASKKRRQPSEQTARTKTPSTGASDRVKDAVSPEGRAAHENAANPKADGGHENAANPKADGGHENAANPKADGGHENAGHEGPA
jgi:hypothetical protein